MHQPGDTWHGWNSPPHHPQGLTPLGMLVGKHSNSPYLARSSSAQSPQPPQKKTTSQAQETRVPGHSPRGLPTSASSKRFLWVDFASHPDTPPPTSPTTWLGLLPPTILHFLSSIKCGSGPRLSISMLPSCVFPPQPLLHSPLFQTLLHARLTTSTTP